jgi:hypothetical protein
LRVLLKTACIAECSEKSSFSIKASIAKCRRDPALSMPYRLAICQVFLDAGVVGGGLLQVEQVWLSIMKGTNNRIRLCLCDQMRKACIIQWPALEICRRRVWQAIAQPFKYFA